MMIDLLLENNKKNDHRKQNRAHKQTHIRTAALPNSAGGTALALPYCWALHTIAMKFWGSGDASDRRHVDIIVVAHLP